MYQWCVTTRDSIYTVPDGHRRALLNQNRGNRVLFGRSRLCCQCPSFSRGPVNVSIIHLEVEDGNSPANASIPIVTECGIVANVPLEKGVAKMGNPKVKPWAEIVSGNYAFGNRMNLEYVKPGEEWMEGAQLWHFPVAGKVLNAGPPYAEIVK